MNQRGPLAWMACNSVAANLFMLCLLVGGGLTLSSIRQEVFPEFELDIVLVNIAYPGASPSEVEEGIILAVEESIREVDGIKEVNSTAAEGTAVVTIELLLGTNANRALSDIKNAVDRITSFPADIERPVVSLATNRAQVISLVLYGDVPEATLRQLAEISREELLTDPGITMVELEAVRNPEISVEIPQATLRSFGLTLEQVAARIREASVDVPAGGVKTASGEILLRTTERRDVGTEFENIVIRSLRDGREVKLGDIANVKDGFEESDRQAFYNGKRAAMVKVFRVADQTPIEIAKTVKRYAENKRTELPPGVGVATWADMSEMYSDRIDLLMRNGYLGLILVMATLGLFLKLRLAFWVTMGIPISFMGSLLLLPGFDVSINMISLFAFIVSLGIVVDDAIVVGEAIFLQMQKGKRGIQAAIAGVREVAGPVVFSVLTTMIAFTPLLVIPGTTGKFFRVIPLIVIAVLALSLLESLFILPAHLAHGGRGEWQRGPLAAVARFQERFALHFDHFLNHRYIPFAAKAVRNRYLTVSICVALLLLSAGWVGGGHINFTFLPRIDSDRVVATLTMPFGTSVQETERAQTHIQDALVDIFAEFGGRENLVRGVFSEVGGLGGGFASPRGSFSQGGSHLAQLTVYMLPSDKRELTARKFANAWRERVGELPGAESLKFRFSTGPHGGDAMEFQISHRNMSVLEEASAKLAQKLHEFEGVFDIEDGFELGKEQLDFTLRPQARVAGFTEQSLARQVRAAFFGAEATRQLRGRDEVRTYVRLPRNERESEYNVEEMLLIAPNGDELPLATAAKIERGRAYTSIRRTDGRRKVNVTADVIPNKTNANKVMEDIEAEFIPTLLANYPGLQYERAGSGKRQAETFGSLKRGFVMALIAMFGLLAIAFKSYVQPIIIMMVIPFGMIGALLGHILMGFDLSMISMMGIVALSGIVVNDSLILIVAINRIREEGTHVFEAIVQGAARRFRPILLTSLTTFFGLVPMIVETSVQARFLIPMALSLGFGVLLATGIMLVLVPSVYMIVDEIRGWILRHKDRLIGDAGAPSSDPAT